MNADDHFDSHPGHMPVVRAAESFDTFYQREWRSVMGLAFVLSKSPLAAEDLTQDAFLAAYRRWDEVGMMDDPGAWVRRVVANRSVSRIRRRVAEVRALTRMAGREHVVRVPDQEAENKALWAEVGRLPARQRQAVALYYYLGLTMPEIATTLGLSKDTVNTHLRRARATLAKRLRTGEER